MPHEEVKERNIEHVLKTAYELFLANGVEGTTKEMLVRASGISRSSLDRYFTDKADLVLQTARWIGEHVRERNARLLAGFGDARVAGLEMLRAYLETVRDLLYENPRLFALGAECRIFIFRSGTDERCKLEALARALGSPALLEKIFERGRADGSMPAALDARMEALLTRETVLGVFTSIALSAGPPPAGDRAPAQRLIEQILGRYQPDR